MFVLLFFNLNSSHLLSTSMLIPTYQHILLQAILAIFNTLAKLCTSFQRFMEKCIFYWYQWAHISFLWRFPHLWLRAKCNGWFVWWDHNHIDNTLDRWVDCECRCFWMGILQESKGVLNDVRFFGGNAWGFWDLDWRLSFPKSPFWFILFQTLHCRLKILYYQHNINKMIILKQDFLGIRAAGVLLYYVIFLFPLTIGEESR